MKCLSVILGALCILTSHVWAENASDARLKSLVGLIEMEKLTVGPYDNFQPTIRSNESMMFFVRKTGLTNQIYSQKLPNVDPVAFVSGSADSQQPALSPDGETLAYISFESRSLGNICTTPSQAFKPTCLNISQGQVSSPFWINNTDIGYLIKDIKTNISKIVIQTAGGATRDIVSGQLWSPTPSQDGRYLSYISSPMTSKTNEQIENQRDVVIRDMKTGREVKLKTNLPGNPGFAAFSVANDYLYFSYYFSDTSGDQRIDGNDNSVILRAPLAPILAEKDALPEQLTSLTNNCNFPRPATQFLYVSCAFEGALDIYRLPLTGILPTSWTQSQLLDSYKTSRSYGDRLLLLQNIQRRFNFYSQNEYSARHMSNHLLAEDYSAASYYAAKLYQMTKDDVYLGARIFADAWALVGGTSDRLPSARMREQLNQYLSQLKEIKSNPWLRDVVRIRINAFLDRRNEARAAIQKLKWPEHEHPLARYIYFHTAKDLLRTPGTNLQETKTLYLRLMNAPEFTDESRLFYAFEWLTDLQKQMNDVKARKALVDSAFTASTDPQVKLLLQAEIYGLDIIGAQAKEKAAIYGKLTQLASQNQKNYFLSRAMYVRNILALADANEFQFLNYVSNNWVRFTAKDSSEYIQAIRQFKTAVLSRAYDAYSKKDYSVSSSLFYGSLSVIDDLESHFGFIVTKLIEGQRQTLMERYAFLEKSGFAKESMKYVLATLDVIDFQTGQPNAEKVLDRAISRLESMADYINDPARRLLLGYCYMEKAFLKSKGLEIDRASFEKAHFHLMLATDLGHDNDRILSSAYQDLAILHQRALNHGLAVEFFQKQKKKIGFLTQRDEIDWAYSIAKSYFYLGQYGDAYQTIKQISPLVPAEERSYLSERLAFYAFAQENYPVAAQHYKELDQLGPIDKRPGSAQIQLAYAVSLFHADQPALAKARFENVVRLTETKTLGSPASESVPMTAERMRLIALGYLSLVSSTDQEKSTYLTRYSDALNQSDKNLEGMGIRRDSFIKYKMIADLRRLDSTQDTATRQELIENVATELKSYVKETGQYLGPTISESLSTLLGEINIGRDQVTPKTIERITEIYEKYIRSADAQPFSPPLAKQRLRLDGYWNAFKNSDPRSVRNHAWYKRLTETAPKLAADLDQLLLALSGS